MHDLKIAGNQRVVRGPRRLTSQLDKFQIFSDLKGYLCLAAISGIKLWDMRWIVEQTYPVSWGNEPQVFDAALKR